MCACAFQELKHLRSVGKKGIVYPDGFACGLKRLVKSVLEEFGKQFNERPDDDAAKSAPVVPLPAFVRVALVHLPLLQARQTRSTVWNRQSFV